MKAAIWVRVSHTTGDQDTVNQVEPLQLEARRRGLDVVRTFDVSGSAWNPGKVAGEVNELVRGVQRREYTHVLVWALDRLTRQGLGATIGAVSKIEDAGGTLISLQEPWVEQTGDMRDLLLAFVGWAAGFESKRRSERIKAGNAAKKAAGGRVGRQPGAKDKAPRRRAGYAARYDVAGRQRVR
jgi:DNA invertase Pin-like site-specific DNA recombinase